MNVLDRLQTIFTGDGFSFQRDGDEFLFSAHCGLFDTIFRVFERALLVVLIGEIGVPVPPGLQTAVIEFCNLINFALLTHGSLAMNPSDGQVQFRRVLMLPLGGELSETQLRLFLSSAIKESTTLSAALAQVAINGANPQTVVTEMNDSFGDHENALHKAGFDSLSGAN